MTVNLVALNNKHLLSHILCGSWTWEQISCVVLAPGALGGCCQDVDKSCRHPKAWVGLGDLRLRRLVTQWWEKASAPPWLWVGCPRFHCWCCLRHTGLSAGDLSALMVRKLTSIRVSNPKESEGEVTVPFGFISIVTHGHFHFFSYFLGVSPYIQLARVEGN